MSAASDIRAFQKIVWSYYKKNGRDLPWRHTHDPYRIVVSEIMLQQTQVSRVLVKYPEFLKAFPNFRALHAAPVPAVLNVWQGMGYNRRALALKAIAERVTREYRGRLPQDPAVLVTFPSIGPNTAGSIAAFAYNAPVAFIETNVRRVFIHHFFPAHPSVSDKELLPIVERAIHRKNPREWYYALMDYGSMLGATLRGKEGSGKENPNKRSKGYRVQAAFEGSKRQLRGKILKLLLANGPMRLVDLREQLAAKPEAVAGVVAELQKERFLKVVRGSITLAE